MWVEAPVDGDDGTSGSEPLMKCRKRIDDVETGEKSLPWDESGGWPVCCDIRHEGGVTLELALGRTVGTCRPDGQGEDESPRDFRRLQLTANQGAARPPHRRVLADALRCALGFRGAIRSPSASSRR